MPSHPDPKMQVHLDVSQVRSQRKRWAGSVGSVNSTHVRGMSSGVSATGSPYVDRADYRGPMRIGVFDVGSGTACQPLVGVHPEGS